MNQDTLKDIFNYPDQPPQGYIIAFDYGSKRIGVAIGQTITQTATPLEYLLAKSQSFWQEIQRLITRWQPSILLVGIPLHMDGAHQPVTYDALNFAQALTKRFTLPVYRADERLSSYLAESELAITQDKFKKKQPVDSIAAQIILENWLKHWSFDS